MDSLALRKSLCRTPWCPLVILRIFLWRRRRTKPPLILVKPKSPVYYRIYLPIWQQSFQLRNIGTTHWECSRIKSPNLFRFLSSKMTAKTFHSQKLTRARNFKASGSPFVGFKFWHFVIPCSLFLSSTKDLAIKSSPKIFLQKKALYQATHLPVGPLPLFSAVPYQSEDAGLPSL